MWFSVELITNLFRCTPKLEQNNQATLSFDESVLSLDPRTTILPVSVTGYFLITIIFISGVAAHHV